MIRRVICLHAHAHPLSLQNLIFLAPIALPGSVEDFVTLQFIPPGTDLKPILPALANVFDQVNACIPDGGAACDWSLCMKRWLGELPTQGSPPSHPPPPRPLSALPAGPGGRRCQEHQLQRPGR